MVFQFQHGAIKSTNAVMIIICPTNFNSNMVRLKARIENVCLEVISYFNSNMVRLKGLPGNGSKDGKNIFQFQHPFNRTMLELK